MCIRLVCIVQQWPNAAPDIILVALEYIECRALRVHGTTGAKSLNYAQTTEQRNTDKRRLDLEGCLSDSIVSVAKRAESVLLALLCRIRDPTLMKYY